MKLLGIDLGSREVKVVVMENQEISQQLKVSTMSFYRDYCNFTGKIVVDLKKLGVEDADIKISTGYGKNNTDLKEFETINELKAHVYGVFYQTELKDFVLLDVGGQDVKVVRVEKGLITDLELNEKCAASCGRYLENMAEVLEVPLTELVEYSRDPVELNSTCAVFSESELIGKIAEGAKLERLCAGVNYSMYKRLDPLLTKFKGKRLVLSGGVAQNKAIRDYLTQDYEEVISLAKPQFNGAIGCCYYGRLKH
ncbi:acyl-CoA dehydratase activase [Natroniella acetigena]|uniref:acyl-CoA dehydratase activase n=1 Tax=Natroniella acetigena TaxID=52004 RepID=UPI00200A8DD8|nr:acyl-CoA dehydratase activase [Natroniella acetigena]MCK8828554.1 acyl-CoA dehydratase activase [Natroniella acetigena]